jgi:hypothetical protein
VPVAEAVQSAYSHLPRGTLKAVLALKKKRERTKEPIALLERAWTADLITQSQSFDPSCKQSRDGAERLSLAPH